MRAIDLLELTGGRALRPPVLMLMEVVVTVSSSRVHTGVKVGIIGAMESEVQLLLAAVDAARPVRVAGMNLTEGHIGGVEVIVACSGVGKVNAAMCATVLTCGLGATHVINTGVAGSLDGRIRVGDIVVSTDAVEHDMDVSALGYQPGEHPDLHLVAFDADAGLRAEAVEAARASGAGVFEGRVCSGDQFIGSVESKARVAQTFRGLCCEMEGAAIAHVCHLAGVPFVVVRAISDQADGSSPVSYAEFEKKAAARCAGIVLAMLPKVA